MGNVQGRVFFSFCQFIETALEHEVFLIWLSCDQYVSDAYFTTSEALFASSYAIQMYFI